MTTTQQIFHHLRFDLRRHWLLLSLLAIGLTAAGVIDAILLLGEPRQIGIHLTTISAFGFGIILVLIVIHGDPATGSEHFWLTRPLRGLEIFLSKAIFVLLIALLMLAGWILPPLFTGALSAMGGLICDYWKFFVPFLAGFLAIAAFTRNLPQALLAGIITWASVTGFFWLWTLAVGNLPIWDKTVAMRESGWMIGVGIITAGAFATAMIQYVYSSLKVSIPVFAIAIFSAVLVTQYSTVDLLTKKIDAAGEKALGLENASVVLNVAPENLQRGNHTVHNPAGVFRYVTFGADTKVEGLPAAINAGQIAIRGTLFPSNRDGTAIPSRTGRFDTHHGQLRGFLPAGYRYLDSRRRAETRSIRPITFVHIARDDYPSLTGHDWRYEGIASCRLVTFSKVDSVPLGSEVKIQRSGWTALLSSKVDPGMLRVDLKIRSWNRTSPDSSNGFTCLIVKSVKQEALPPRSGGGVRGVGGFRHNFQSRTFFYDLESWNDGERAEISEDWLEDAEVVFFKEKPLGVIDRPVVVESFELPEITEED